MKLLLLLMCAGAAYSQADSQADVKPITPSLENELLKLQNEHLSEQLAMEKATVPFKARMSLIEARWNEAVAKMRKEFGLPDSCIVTPERKWKCPEKKPDETSAKETNR